MSTPFPPNVRVDRQTSGDDKARKRWEQFQRFEEAFQALQRGSAAVTSAEKGLGAARDTLRLLAEDFERERKALQELYAVSAEVTRG